MAAYGAAISLKTTIRRILQSSRTWLVPPSGNILNPAYEAMDHLQEVLLELEGTGYSKIRTEVNALDDRIKEAIWEFEDLLESHFYDQILPQLESSSVSERDHLPFSVDLQSLQQSVDCLVERLAAMEVEYNDELLNMPEEEGEPISSRIDFRGIDSMMVGLSYEFEQVRNLLLAEDIRHWLAIIGMAGVGKTTFAKKLFDDPSIQRHFELRAWVKVGRKCEPKETLQCILAQVDHGYYDRMLARGDDHDAEKLVGVLEERLKDKKCLVVLDDIWEWDSRVLDILPQENARILFTSRLTMQLRQENARVLHTSILRMKEAFTLKVRFLDKGESKKLLGEKVFGEEGFPIHLEKLGEKIALKCEGLPLMIVKVAELLSKEDKTIKNWIEVAEKQQNSVFVNAYDQISEVLYPSYNYLPQYLKMFFLYLGAFPPYIDIKVHNLLRELIAEGFVEAVGKQTLEYFMVDCTIKLSRGYHLVLLESNQQPMLLRHDGFRVHSCLQHLCKKEASKIKFLHVLQSWDDDDDIIRNQRRLCVHCNTLFAFKQVCDSINSECASTVRSLLCLGPYHKYSVPIHAMDFKLLRVLDALAVRFYHIPLEIMKLVCLKYIALTCNAELPHSISDLFHLQSLIIHPHMCIRKRGTLSYMPLEIWDMQELQHIEVRGRDLPTPNSDATLHKLSFLFGVSAKSCTREILKRIPNLERLEIQVELKPYDDDNDSNPLSRLGYISEELRNLEVLRYRVENPNMEHESIIPLSIFPSSLTSLYLSGFGCPWKHIKDICSLLPNLMDLSLQQYAFRGLEWEIESGCLLKLEDLTIGDTNLVRWRARHGSLPRLHLLSIHHCYKLQRLDWTRDDSMGIIPTIELVECNPLAVASAMQLSPKSHFKVLCHSSF